VSVAQVNGALSEELKDIHALSIKKVWTPAQQQQQAAAATAG
jgi:stress-induced morphogen